MPLHPHLAERLPALAGLDWTMIEDPAARAAFATWEEEPPGGRPLPAAATREVTLSAPGRDVRVRVYEPEDRGAASGGVRPGLVWVHGGAFMGGDLDMPEADGVAREIVARTGGVVVSVDYSLVPAVAFPVPHRQVMRAFTWMREQAAELGIAPDRIVLGGASAGGALSLSAARELVASGGPAPAALVLAYPVAHAAWELDPELQARMAELPRMLRFLPTDTTMITGNYLGTDPDVDRRFAFVDLDPAGPRAALAGLPPSLVLICEYDDLRTSAELFARAARAAGRPVRTRLFEGMVHGHLNRTTAFAEVDASLDEIARVVRDPDVLADDGS